LTLNQHRDRSNESRPSSFENIDKEFQNFSKTPREIPSANIVANYAEEI